MLSREKKKKIIKKAALHEKDTGSAAVQVSILTERINRLSAHLTKNKKDKHSRRGLLKMVVRRRKLLDYLKHTNEEAYAKITAGLKLKNK
ncbi:MAG: 30S ribosomal protein S15 [Candidatus Moranbacteria bacterium]|nr:30S ribosomal protein S15 [Candidatus Moranbacteria bacterium]